MTAVAHGLRQLRLRDGWRDGWRDGGTGTDGRTNQT